MRANEFFKKFGLDYAYKFLNYNASIAEDRCVLDFGEYHNLKRLVESHELVEKLGGLESAKKELQRQSILRWINPETERLRVAIADVESCL